MMKSKVFAISDLHLSFSTDKPMNIFGDNWNDHYKKIESDWKSQVRDNDIVVVAGDISWGINEEESEVDLLWVEKLPGTKIFIKGNHDYWWKSLKKLNEKYKTIKFIQNNAVVIDDYIFCGTRGWDIPYSETDESDLKIYNREILRLKNSIKDAKKCCDNKEIILVTHYPPITKRCLSTEFNNVIIQNNIKTVIYGHLHGKDSFLKAVDEEINGIRYYLTSCDYLDFKLIDIR